MMPNPTIPVQFPMDSIFQVDLTDGPTYQASVLGPNFANLSFGPQNLAVGQELVVHGGYTKPPASKPGAPSSIPFTVEPTAIYLKMQSMQGTLNSMLSVVLTMPPAPLFSPPAARC